ncbi:MAG TPA: lantibiotic dehydratase [Streptosporangiaceae bacterium]|nr:lantibiotic dehydratase [Streptosporangiaceae bacterium]
MTSTDQRLITLPGTEWQVWRDAVLRTTGFPADGLLRLSAPDCAAVADACLDGQASAEDFDRALGETVARSSREVYSIATDPLFRTAVTWQSPSSLIALDGIAKAGPQPCRNSKQRQRETVVARYWQRYCGKTETIGFFGPVCWVTVDPDLPTVSVQAGPDLVRDRRVVFEHWVLAGYADSVAADPRARRWLPPALQPHLTVAGGQVLDPVRPPAPLSMAEQAVLAWCDGHRPARDVAQAVLAQPGSRLRKEEDVYLLLGMLAERGLLRWNLDLPISHTAERVLSERIAAIGDPQVRQPAMTGLTRLQAARDTVAVTAGDPDKLAAALDALGAGVADLTGLAATRKPGEAYAGRMVCVEDTTRDLDVTIGAGILAAIATPLGIFLQAARWVTTAMAQSYLAALAGLHAELAADLGTPEVPLGQLWFLAQGLFYGPPPRPADQVTAEFGRRLRALYGLGAPGAPGTPGTPGAPGAAPVSRLELRSDALLPHVAGLFPAEHPGWPAARIHSPDLLICAPDTDALRRGDFTVVLSELHMAWATCGSQVFASAHPDPARLRAAYRADVGGGRVYPLLPADWPRNSPRLAFAFEGPGDIQLGFAPAPGADPERLLPVTAVSVTSSGGSLLARGPGGRTWPLAEMFARPLAEVTVNALKLAPFSRPQTHPTAPGAHTPRITIDRVVVAREAWQTTVAAASFAHARTERERYLAARRWRRELGLPEQVFVTIGTETKPVFTDLTSPLYMESLGAMLRSARRDGGDEVPVLVTEMLPTCDQAWVPGAAGRRYLSELRLHVTDPRPALSEDAS